MSYDITSREYLQRAMARIAEGSQEALFYAAFELRCGIEARMREYLEVWEHISKQKKNGWQIAKLGQDIESAFKTGDKFVRFAVQEQTSERLAICFYHTPVTTRLRT